MSTWLYLKCTEHDPPLFADEESGQHLYDLPTVRADVANREAVVWAASEGFTPSDYFRANTARFLMQHPKCRIEIEDEYGRDHPVEAGDDE